MLHLLVRERQGRLAGPLSGRPELAIASCGNAAVAAAVVAAAERWPISVYVPEDAEAAVVARLRELGATIEFCPRINGEDGDPSYHRFREAVGAGAVPFGCQGPDNGYTIDGGRTLGYELAEQAPEIDRVYVQVGGGALAASVAQGLAIAGSSACVDSGADGGVRAAGTGVGENCRAGWAGRGPSAAKRCHVALDADALLGGYGDSRRRDVRLGCGYRGHGRYRRSSGGCSRGDGDRGLRGGPVGHGHQRQPHWFGGVGWVVVSMIHPSRAKPAVLFTGAQR